VIGRGGTVMLVACIAAQTASADLPKLVRGGAAGPDGWLVSDWDAGQSTLLRWHPGNVFVEDGSLHFRLDRAPDGSARPLRGAEIQSGHAASEGTWSWRVKAPEMVPGAVFGLFLYKANHRKDPWREYDIEFVGADTTKIQLNIHFETEDGRHVSLDQARGEPVVVDLGFDAAEDFHDYAITVGVSEAVFLVDGEVVGRFGPDDMPEGTWSRGKLRSFVDLWAVAPAQEDWAGRWRWPGRPLVAELLEASVPR
jgi:beta-glucanase (GH16 family)